MKHSQTFVLTFLIVCLVAPTAVSAKARKGSSNTEISALDSDTMNVIPLNRDLKKKLKKQRKSKLGSKKKQPELCADSEFGIQFYCETNWKWRRIKDAIMIVIDVEPTVTLTIKKMDGRYTFLSQLTNDRLKGIGLYADGFRTERVPFAQKEAIKVKAFSGKYENIRLANYFYVHNNNLYGALFSVQPKEDWEKQQFVIKKVVESFSFIN